MPESAPELLSQITRLYRQLKATDRRFGSSGAVDAAQVDVRSIEAEIRTLADRYTALVLQQYEDREHLPRRQRTG